MTKKCRICTTLKDISNFNISRSDKSGFQGVCRECERNRWYKVRYNIDYKDFLYLKEKQKDKCKLCNKKKKLHLDHCHKTGKIRALLCIHCNMGLGNFKESLVVLNKAIKYLIKHKGD